MSVDRTTATITRSGSSELVLNMPGLPYGTHLGRITIAGSDALDCDNERFFTVNVLPPSSVLIVGSQPKELDVIESTIAATVTEVPDEDAEFQVQQIGFNDLPVAVLDDFDAIMLIDPPATAFSETSLREYCENGGNVLACLGPRFTPQHTPALQASTPQASAPQDSEAHTSNTRLILPQIVRTWRIPEAGTFFQVMQEQHPAVETLSGDTPWDQFPVSQYWQVRPSAADSVLIQYSGTGHPALIQRSILKEANSQNEPQGKGATPFAHHPDPSARSRNKIMESALWIGSLASMVTHTANRRAFDGTSNQSIHDDDRDPRSPSNCQKRKGIFRRDSNGSRPRANHPCPSTFVNRWMK